MNDEKSDARDRELGMDRPISRRDFLNGALVSAGMAMSCGWLLEAETAGLRQDESGYYPPTLTGMRGSHPGSFETAHAERDGSLHHLNAAETGETYDLVIVGGGISGLAAAHFYRARTSQSAKILILDNHDDFGGHAKRNEFHIRGRTLLANGGTVAIESPYPYSQVAHALMAELGIDPLALSAKCDDRSVYRGLSSAYFFDKETFGRDCLVKSPGSERDVGAPVVTWPDFLRRSPLSPAVQRDILRVQEGKADYLPDLDQAAKKDRLSRMSYRDYLLYVAKADPGVIPFYQTRTHDLYGAGIDAISALDCWALDLPGFGGMKLDRVPHPRVGFTPGGELIDKPPYFFHFPDGNASIARMLLRSLIPDAMPGHTAEDSVSAPVNYSRLDNSAFPLRLRLSSTVVHIQHLGDPPSARGVAVTYVCGKNAYSVKAKSVVMACWNMMIPYVCPELPVVQKEALRYGAKVPLVYTVVAVDNWQAWQKLAVHSVDSPGMYHVDARLDLAINIGQYRCSHKPDEPILIRMLRTPCKPGLSERDQHRAGRAELLSTSFETFERNIRDQLARILSAGGFDPARDIEAITVNRWPHGYAYEYNWLWDPDWPKGQMPCEIARRPFGRIAIANSDAAAAAYTDQAIDQAYRAVGELFA
jgi:spermidine dehydrogenase